MNPQNNPQLTPSPASLEANKLQHFSPGIVERTLVWIGVLPAPMGPIDSHSQKSVLLKLIDRCLDICRIQQASSWRLGCEEGWQRGYTKGHESGRKKGVEEGKQIVVLEPGPLPVPGEPGIKPPAMFKSWTFGITQDLEDEIREDFKRLKNQPSPAQWKMILSTTPTTSVVAGAGSGKSTTMVLRLLVLHHYLGIRLESLTVITFTRESKLDFAKKVREVFALWEYEISEKESLDIVRTFHSRILSFTRSIPGLGGVQAFEFLDKKNDEDEKEGSMFQVKLGSEQLAIMNTCYQQLYESNPVFKDLIAFLVRRAVMLERMDADSPDAVERRGKAAKIALIDEAACNKVEALWEASKRWPIAGIEPKREKVTLLGREFLSNGFIPELGAYVILGMDNSEPPDTKAEPGRKRDLRWDILDKKILFQAFCSKPVIFLDRYTDAAASIGAIRNLTTTCPKFRYKVTGELSSLYILEAFYSAASFIENLGLDVIPAIKAMNLRTDDPDRKFFSALGLYWVALKALLRSMSPPVLTFNSMFAMFSERGERNLRALPDGVLQPMSTLLIDEFQDVGANTISWVKATFAEIERRDLSVWSDGPPAYASLMAVGDDWQSIYGWRGSSPQFFMEFDKHFVAPPSTQVFMQENHRSHQWIIDAAEAIVRRTGGFKNKQGKAANPLVLGNKVAVEVRDPSFAHLKQTVKEHYEAGRSVLILYRVGRTKDAVETNLKDLLRRAKDDKREHELKLLTYHASKGLQADAVFLLGDCEMTTKSPFKNDIFKQAQLGDLSDPCGYDTSQKHEALRTAYVAITRAISYCYWYLDRKEGKVPAYEKASRYVDPALPCWNVVPSTRPPGGSGGQAKSSRPNGSKRYWKTSR